MAVEEDAERLRMPERGRMPPPVRVSGPLTVQMPRPSLLKLMSAPEEMPFIEATPPPETLKPKGVAVPVMSVAMLSVPGPWFWRMPPWLVPTWIWRVTVSPEP